MSKEIFPYNQWVNEALLNVLARALKQLSKKEPSGNHHLYIDIQTSYYGVEIPEFLRAQYPEEITIVLQHQFEGLIVNENSFEVSLSFSGKKGKLKIPFGAVTSFADPSVNFALQIGAPSSDEKLLPVNSETELIILRSTDKHETEKKIEPISLVEELSHSPKNSDKVEKKNSTSVSPENKNEKHKNQTAEVITLDTFRKK